MFYLGSNCICYLIGLVQVNEGEPFFLSGFVSFFCMQWGCWCATMRLCVKDGKGSTRRLTVYIYPSQAACLGSGTVRPIPPSLFSLLRPSLWRFYLGGVFFKRAKRVFKFSREAANFRWIFYLDGDTIYSREVSYVSTYLGANMKRIIQADLQGTFLFLNVRINLYNQIFVS